MSNRDFIFLIIIMVMVACALFFAIWRSGEKFREREEEIYDCIIEYNKRAVECGYIIDHKRWEEGDE